MLTDRAAPESIQLGSMKPDVWKKKVYEEGEQSNGMECGLQLWPTSASWDFLIMQHTEKTDVSRWTHGWELTVCLTPLAGPMSTAEFIQLWWCNTRPSSNVTSLHTLFLFLKILSLCNSILIIYCLRFPAPTASFSGSPSADPQQQRPTSREPGGGGFSPHHHFPLSPNKFLTFFFFLIWGPDAWRFRQTGTKEL